MNSAEAAKRERFSTLLDRIQMEPDIKATFFQDAYIEKLQLHPEKRMWVFYLVFSNLCPPHIFQSLVNRLKNAFSQVAQIDVIVRFKDGVEAKAIFDHYWPLFIDQHKEHFNGLYRRMETTPPTWENGSLTVFLYNEIEESIFRDKVEPVLRSFYRHFSLKINQIHYHLVDDQEEYNRFIQDRQQEDLELAKQAVESIERRERTVTNGKRGQMHSNVIIGSPFSGEAVPLKEIREGKTTWSLRDRSLIWISGS